MTVTLGKVIKEARERTGMTQYELATKLGYTVSQSVSNWERDVVTPPPVMLKKMAKRLDINMTRIIDIMTSTYRKELTHTLN